MKASSISFRLACVFALAGIAMGIGMAVSGRHELIPAHSHLNLLGWVSLFLFGVYYRLHPASETKALAGLHIGVWTLCTAMLTVAVAGIQLGHDAFKPVAAIGSLGVLASFGAFVTLVFTEGRPVRSRPAGSTREA